MSDSITREELEEQLQDAHDSVLGTLDTIATTAGGVVDYGAGATCYPDEVRKALGEIEGHVANAMDGVSELEQLAEELSEWGSRDEPHDNGDGTPNGLPSLNALLLERMAELGIRNQTKATIQAPQRDPYRMEKYRPEAEWLAAAMERIPHRPIHVRGLHYAAIDTVMPDGTRYQNTEKAYRLDAGAGPRVRRAGCGSCRGWTSSTRRTTSRR